MEEIINFLNQDRIGRAAAYALENGLGEEAYRVILEQALTTHQTSELQELVDSMLCLDLSTLELETLESLFEVMRAQKHPRRQEIAAMLGVEAAPEIIRPPMSKGAVRQFTRLFQGREDIHARQFQDGSRGGYSPVRQPLNEDVVRRHLSGQISVGMYLLNSQNCVQFFAIDFDIRRTVLEGTPADTSTLLRQLRDEILQNHAVFQNAGLDPWLEFSGGKGFHVWFFLAEPVPAQLVRSLMKQTVLEHLEFDRNLFQLELFPKQDKVNRGGLGNLIKLPLGRHKVSRRWSWFLDWHGTPIKDLEDLLLTQIKPMYRNTFLDLVASISPQGVEQSKWYGVGSISENNPEIVLNEPSSHSEGIVPKPAYRRPDDLPYRRLVAGCDTLRTLIKRIETLRVVEPNERHTLTYMLAPIGEAGYIEIHRLLSMTLDYHPDEVNRLIKAVPPHLISCPKVRKRIPTIASHSNCKCVFNLPEGVYPSPLVHANLLPKASGGVLEERTGVTQNEPVSHQNLERNCESFLQLQTDLENITARLEEVEFLLKRELGDIPETGVQIVLRRGQYQILYQDERLILKRIYNSFEVSEE